MDRVPVELRLLFAGGASGAITYTLIAPLERTKILLQVQGMRGSAKYQSVGQTILRVVREEGILALYKGNLANVARVVPTYALKFMFNDRFKLSCFCCFALLFPLSHTQHISDLVRKPGQAKNKMSFSQDLTAGTLAGLFQMTITYPIETVRTRLTLSTDLAGGTIYRGIGHCFLATAKVEGVSALYKGFGVALLSGAPYVGLQMSIYKLAQQLLPTRADGSSAVYWKMASGAAAGLVAQSLMYPGDTLRRRMQTNGIGGEARVYNSTWHCCQIIMRKEGVKGFYRGLTANSLKVFPLAGFQFVFFDLLKVALNC